MVAGAATVLLLFTAGCAVANQDRRLLLNAMDASLTPGSTAGRWLLAPVALPVGFVAGVTDAVVVHPVTQLDDAWGDTVELLWQNDGATDFRRAVLTPVLVLATPLVFAGDWLGRSVFDVPDRAPAEIAAGGDL